MMEASKQTWRTELKFEKFNDIDTIMAIFFGAWIGFRFSEWIYDGVFNLGHLGFLIACLTAFILFYLFLHLNWPNDTFKNRGKHPLYLYFVPHLVVVAVFVALKLFWINDIGTPEISLSFIREAILPVLFWVVLFLAWYILTVLWHWKWRRKRKGKDKDEDEKACVAEVAAEEIAKWRLYIDKAI